MSVVFGLPIGYLIGLSVFVIGLLSTILWAYLDSSEELIYMFLEWRYTKWVGIGFIGLILLWLTALVFNSVLFYLFVFLVVTVLVGLIIWVLTNKNPYHEFYNDEERKIHKELTIEMNRISKIDPMKQKKSFSKNCIKWLSIFFVPFIFWFVVVWLMAYSDWVVREGLTGAGFNPIFDRGILQIAVDYNFVIMGASVLAIVIVQGVVSTMIVTYKKRVSLAKEILIKKSSEHRRNEISPAQETYFGKRQKRIAEKRAELSRLKKTENESESISE